MNITKNVIKGLGIGINMFKKGLTYLVVGSMIGGLLITLAITALIFAF